MITVVDSGICNLASVLRALERVSVPFAVAPDATALEQASAILLPGVGAFGDGMASLRDRGMVEPLRAHAHAGKPLVGICLGMQLLAEESEEHGRHAGLGLIPGRVVALPAGDPVDRVPNIGWCDVEATHAGVLFPASYRTRSFYFVHGLHLHTAASITAATIRFAGRPVVAAIEHGSIFGVQFHPEKSQGAGLDLLDAVANHIRQRTHRP